jgi:hypothetical protein
MTMGQLRKRWNVWWIRYYRDGRRIEESSGTSSYDEAKTVLRTREGAWRAHHRAIGAPEVR